MCLLQSCSTVSLSPCRESWWTQRSPQLQLSWRICGNRLLSAFPQDLCHLLHHQLGLYSVSWRLTLSSSVMEHLGRPCCRCMTAHTEWWPSLQRCSSCSWGAVWSRSQWTDSSPVCPQRLSQRFHRGEAVLLFNLQNLSVRPPFLGGRCRGQLILESTGDNPPTAIEKSVGYYYYISQSDPNPVTVNSLEYIYPSCYNSIIRKITV